MTSAFSLALSANAGVHAGGPCQEAIVQRRSEFLAISGERASRRSSAFDAQAQACGRAGHTYFAARGTGGRGALGLCLPAACVLANQRDLSFEARRLIGARIGRVFRYTSFESSPNFQISDKHKATSENSAVGADPVGIELGGFWTQVRFQDLRNRPALPRLLPATETLVIVLRDFRGNNQDYLHAIHTVVSMVTWHAAGVKTFLVPGHQNFMFSVHPFHVHVLAGPPLCGKSTWWEVKHAYARGLEILLPPLWRLLSSSQLPRHLFHMMNTTAIGARYPGLACELGVEGHLRWTVPQYSLRAALALASRGRCAAAVAKRLPELSRASLLLLANATVPWQQVEQFAMTCAYKLEGAIWEFFLRPEAWPGVLDRILQESKMAGGLATLTAFACLPSRYSVEADFRLVPSESACDAKAAPREALPLIVSFHTGLYDTIEAAPPPDAQAIMVGAGERARIAMDAQLSAYHLRAVRQMREVQASSDQQRLKSYPTAQELRGATPPSLSAAVCIAGRARSLADARVYASIAKNAVGMSGLGADTSIFFVLDTDGRSVGDFAEAFQRLPPAALAVLDAPIEDSPSASSSSSAATRRSPAWGEPVSCKAWRNCGPACYMQFQKLGACRRLIEAAEASRGQRFDWLVRLRPDTSFVAPIGDLAWLDSSKVHMALTASGEPDDNFALVPREFGDAYFAIGEAWCPDEAAESARSKCAIPWQGSHIYPECAIRTRLEYLGIRFAAFPRLYRIRRESICRPGDPRGCGQCTVGVCASTGLVGLG